MTATRLDALRDLLEHRVPAAVAARALAEYGWDADQELVDLDPEHLSHMLTGFVDGSVPAAELADWADAIESREDVGRALGHEELLNDALYELATPDLCGPPEDIVPALLSRLGEAKG